MSVSLPTVVLIPGAWQNPETYEPLRSCLASRGYESICLSPPSTSLSHGETDLAADSSFVHEDILRPLVEEGKDVLVVMHSFAGVYGGGAVKGLSKTERSQSGKPGGIIALVYVAAACIPTGITALQAMGIGEELLPWVVLQNGILTIPEPVPLMFHNLLAQEAQKWASKMKHQAIKPMQSVVTYAPFEDDIYKGHLAYLLCTQDETIHPSGQRKFLTVAGIEVMDEIPTSHMPWLEMADQTTEKILSLAEKVRI
ncbi:alpha beta hydrolase family domain protein [Penicillium herquei]|nr:alpha beta hydrolase family domain protein [Penicillium herquei]